MKKRFLALFCVVSILAGMTACGKKDSPAVSEPPASSPVISAPVDPEPMPEPPVPQSVIVYLPDEFAENLLPTEVEIMPAAADDPLVHVAELIHTLVENHALPEGSEILSVELGEPVKLDMNAAFGDGMMSTGTTGEMLYLGALVNTVLDYADAESILLTVEGAPLETGHNIYDEPIRRINP